MAKNTKVLTVLSTAAVTGLITAALGSTAFAKTSGILVQNGSNDYRYDYSSLASAFEDYSANPANGALYQDYLKQLGGKSPVALYDDAQKTYIDYTKVASAFEDAQAATKPFDLNAFTESSKDVYTPAAPISDVSIGSDGKISYVAEPDTTKLAINSVTALNPKQVKVTFNKAVDTKLASDVSNYSVYAEADTAQTADLMKNGSVALSSDNTSAVLTLGNNGAGTENSLKNYTTKNVVVVKKALGFTADQTNATVALSDITVPTLLKAEQFGPRQIKLTFSEPVDLSTLDMSKVSVDNGAYALNTVASVASAKDCTIIINTYADLAAGQHSVTLLADASGNVAVKDFAGLGVIPNTVNFTYAKDATAPVATVVSTTENKMVIKFSKPVTNLVGNPNVTFGHSYKDPSVNPGVVILDSQDTDKTLYDVTFEHPFAPGATTVYFDYKDGTKDTDKAVDNYGNIYAPTTYTFTTVSDTVPPTIADGSSIKVVDANHVDVTFSKEVSIDTAQAIANYSLKDGSGNAVAITGVAKDSKDGTLVHLTTATMNGGTYTLDVKGIKDVSVAGNTMVEKAIPFVVTDMVPPTVVDLDSSTPGTINSALLDVNSKKVRIAFSEPMSKASIESADNYLLGGRALPAGTVLTASSDLKSVVIDLTSANPATSFAVGNILTVGRVQDLAGNKIAALSTDTTVSLATNPTVALDSNNKPMAYAISSTQVKVVFDRTVSGIVAGDFAVYSPAKSAWVPVSKVASATVDSNGRSVVILQIDVANKFTTDAAGVEVATGTITGGVFTQGPTTGTKDQYSKTANIAATPVIDNAGVESFTATTGDKDNDGELDTITLSFPEELYAASVNNSTFTVAGHTVNKVYVVNDDVHGTATVTLDLSESGVQDALSTPKVTLAGTVEDKNLNPNVSIDAVTPTSGVAASKSASIASDLGLASAVVTPSASGTSATVALSTADQAATLDTIASNMPSISANKITSVVVAGTSIDMTQYTHSGVVNKTDLANAVAKALTGNTSATAVTTSLSALVGKSITINGVTYTLATK